MTNDVAARRYGRSKGWLSTLENGQHIITPQELSDLLDFYGMPHNAERESLIHLAEHGHGETWERPFEYRVSPALRDLASLEAEASDIHTYGPDIIPGLLQIPDYTRRLIEAGRRVSPQNGEALVAFRLARQQILTAPDPPNYRAILGESALRQLIGGPRIMRHQLEHLGEMTQLDNVAIHVLPFSAGEVLWLAGSFHIISLRPPGRLTVSVHDQFARSVFAEEEREVSSHERIFLHLRAACMDEADSLALVQQIASEL